MKHLGIILQPLLDVVALVMKPAAGKDRKKKMQTKVTPLVDFPSVFVVPGDDLAAFHLTSSLHSKDKGIKLSVTSGTGKVPFAPSFKIIGEEGWAIWEDDKGLEDPFMGGSVLQGFILPTDMQACSFMSWVVRDLV